MALESHHWSVCSKASLPLALHISLCCGASHNLLPDSFSFCPLVYFFLPLPTSNPVWNSKSGSRLYIFWWLWASEKVSHWCWWNMYDDAPGSMTAAAKTDPDMYSEHLSTSKCTSVTRHVHNKNRTWPLTCRVTVAGITKCLICFTSLYFCLDHSCYVAQIFEKHFCHR